MGYNTHTGYTKSAQPLLKCERVIDYLFGNTRILGLYPWLGQPVASYLVIRDNTELITYNTYQNEEKTLNKNGGGRRPRDPPRGFRSRCSGVWEKFDLTEALGSECAKNQKNSASGGRSGRGQRLLPS